MKKKKIITGLVVLVALVTLSGCFFGGRQSTTKNEPTKIGVILPLSGSTSKAGDDARAALEIAEADLKSEFFEINLIYEDDGFLPEKSVTAFNKLLFVDQVKAIIGPLNGSSIEAVRSLAAKNKIVVFTPWGAGNKISDYLIKNSVEAEQEAELIASLALSDLGLKKLAIIYLENDWGKIHQAAFKDAVGRWGGELVAAESFTVGTTDFRSALTKIKNSNPDGLYVVASNGSGVGLIAKQTLELGFRPKLFGQYATESSDLVAVGGESLNGLIYTFLIDEANLTEKQKIFREKFQKKTGHRPQIVAYNAYDIYAILVKAISDCRTKDSSCLNDQILSIQNYEGVGGKLSYKDGKIHRPFFFKTIQDGQFVPYEK